MQPGVRNIGGNRREHHWDAVRALLMLLGIPYHVALSYRAGRDWIVYSGEGNTAFTYIAEFIHIFRMPAFFLVAGYFAGMLLMRRTPDAWLQGRFSKLAIPLFVALVTLVPFLNMAAELSHLSLADAAKSWRLNSSTSGGYWVRHLWFIIVLLYCSTAAAVVVWRRPAMAKAKLSARADSWIARHFALALAAVAIVIGLWEAAAVELFYMAGLATNLPQQILRIDELIQFAPYFALGCFLSRAPLTVERLNRFSPVVAVIALASVAASLVFLDAMSPMVGRFVTTIGAVSMTQLIVAAAKQFLDRPIPLVQRIVPASFVIYLVHMPIIMALVVLAQPLMVPVAVKAILLMAMTLTLSYGIWLAVARSPLLSFLYNGDPMPARQRERFA